MVAATIDLVDVEVFWESIASMPLDYVRQVHADHLVRLGHPEHPEYKATGGYCREDAIMILRRFYVTENTNGQLAFGFWIEFYSDKVL